MDVSSSKISRSTILSSLIKYSLTGMTFSKISGLIPVIISKI